MAFLRAYVVSRCKRAPIYGPQVFVYGHYHAAQHDESYGKADDGAGLRTFADRDFLT